ncbi:hypothetical protein AB6A40_001913 [Gnathostoma spinigerum]|uniref:Uncharacterized protein n=1 Tax=Gnathostoma spinigerum TaxID=75299 RepID=A0ABD6EAN9_9BILA
MLLPTLTVSWMQYSHGLIAELDMKRRILPATALFSVENSLGNEDRRDALALLGDLITMIKAKMNNENTQRRSLSPGHSAVRSQQKKSQQRNLKDWLTGILARNILLGKSAIRPG